jgi:hypothetical protein
MRICRQSFYSCVLGMVLLLGVGCAKKLDDAKMSSEIQTKFSQDSGLASKQLTVQANNGVVTLSGSVENAAQRDAAGQQAASIPGVKTVINNLQIGSVVADESPAAKPAPTSEARAPEEKPEPVAKSTKARAPKHNRQTPRSNDQDSPQGLKSADGCQHSSSGASNSGSGSRGTYSSATPCSQKTDYRPGNPAGHPPGGPDR